MEVSKDDKNPILVQFENGLLKDKLRSSIEFDFLRSTKSNKRMLIANTDGLSYLGNVMQKQQNLVKYYVGVIDKRTSKIENIQGVQFCTLKPKLKDEETKSMDEDLTYRQKSDTLVEAFGSSKQKRLASTRKKNENVHDSIDEKVASAAKKLLVDSPRSPWTPGADEGVDSLILPTKNSEAQSAADLYNIDDIIPPADQELLKEHAKEMTFFEDLDLISWAEENKYPGHIIRCLSNLSQIPSSSEERIKRGCYICYLNYLIQFDKVTYRDLSRASRDSCPGVPDAFKGDILERFTQPASENGKIRSRSQKLKDKLHCYIFILALMIENYDMNCNLLVKDLKLGVSKITKLLRAAGCSVTTRNWRPAKTEGAIPAEQVMRAVLKVANEKQEKSSENDAFVTPEKKKRKVAKQEDCD